MEVTDYENAIKQSIQSVVDLTQRDYLRYVDQCVILGEHPLGYLWWRELYCKPMDNYIKEMQKRLVDIHVTKNVCIVVQKQQIEQ